jgi:hypothetical protein
VLRSFAESRYFFGSAIAVIVATSAASWAGCSKQHTAPAPVPAAPAAAQASAGDRGKGEGKIKDVTVFVDGKPVAITRYSELPPGIKWYQREAPLGGLTTKRFLRVYEYIASLGIDPAKVKTIHFHGSHDRIAAIDGDELAKNKESFLFDFTGETYGKPRMKWSTIGLREPTNVDLFTMIAIYIDKAPPVHSEATGDWSLDGKRLDGLPFVNEALPKGTRFYVDGKLMGAVKRRVLPNKFVTSAADAKRTEFSFAAYIESLGVDLAKVKAVDFVNGDSVAYRANAKDLERPDSLVFTISNHMKGKVLAHFPGEKMARVSSVQVFAKIAPPAREIDADAVDQEGGSDDPQSSQDGNDSQKDVNGGNGESEE